MPRASLRPPFPVPAERRKDMDEIIEWLLRLIDFDTTSEGPDAERCVRYIARILAERGALVHAYTTEGALRRGHHLLAEVPGERAETLLLHAHLDTADRGGEQDWLFPAGRASRRRGCVCGRGALDCKGPLAVWMKLLSDAAEGKPRPYTLKLLVTDLEEQGGAEGLGALLAGHPELLSDVKLVIGEGGGFPFPFREDMYYTFQTGEREPAADRPARTAADAADRDRILAMGVEKGYYSEDILAYAVRWDRLAGRRLDVRPLYEDMEDFFTAAPVSAVYADHGPAFASALREEIPNARLMPCVTPGTSDNRWFRNAGVPVVGFFPLDAANSLGGIHGSNEYISESSLRLAYRVMSGALDRIT